MRNQSLEQFLKDIKKLFFKQQSEFPIKSIKTLIMLLLENCDDELRVQLLLLLSQNNALPLLSLSFNQGNQYSLNYNILSEYYWIFQESPCVLCIDFTENELHNEFLNKTFGTCFKKNEFSLGDVEFQLDLNFKSPKRRFSVATTDSNIPKTYLNGFSKFCQYVILSTEEK